MGAIAGPLLIGGGTALTAFEQVESGKEAKRQADAAAAQLRKEAGQIGTMTAEKLHDIEVEKYATRGTAKALGALGGAKVGTGSSRTLLNKIEGAARRKAGIVSQEAGFRRATLLTDAEEYKRRGRNLERAGKRRAFASLLTGGFQFGKSLGVFS